MRQLVIDRNLTRRNGLSGLADQSGIEFILTDTFLVEMVKHPEKWSETVRRDLNSLTPFSNRVRLSLSASEAMHTEIRERRAITRDELLPPEFQSGAHTKHIARSRRKVCFRHLAPWYREFYILKVWRAIWWLQHSGLDAAKDGMLYNDLYDDEYILVASFFDGLLSNECRVKEASAALTRILECSSSDRLLVAFRHYEVDLRN